jgi:hypothetical protein
MFVSDGTNSVVAELTDGSVIKLWHEGAEYDADMRAYRPRYGYVIVAGNDHANGWPYGEGRHGWRYVGNDLRGGCGSAVDVEDAARSLCSFLSAAAEGYAHEMDSGRFGYVSETHDLFPPHVTEWAHMHDDEIGLLAMEAADYE